MATTGSRRGRKKLIAEINVVPYIDVMLVLLVIFMITTPLLTEGVKVDLPQADARPFDSQAPKEPFVVLVNAAGEFFLNEETEPTDIARIRANAAIVWRTNPATPFLVKGDKDATYEFVIQAMVMLQQAGVPNIGMVTQTPPASVQ
ncbi:MAG: protein TolR [Arenicellales bacterium WSBS_2016_MAG_OTU3]